MTASQIVTITTATLVTGALGYAVYFDYKRRNDPQFRSKLRKDAKRTQRETKRRDQQRGKEIDSFIKDTVAETRKPGALPQGLEREQAFGQYVQIGEVLQAQGQAQYLPAAAAFYKALKVYPAPAELLLIYRQAVNAEVLDYVHRMVAADPELTSSGEGAAGAAQSSARIDEIDDDVPASNVAASSSSATGGPAAATTSAPSVSSQEWEKVSRTEEEETSSKKEDHQPAPGVVATQTADGQEVHTSHIQSGTYAAAAAEPVTIPSQEKVDEAVAKGHADARSLPI